MAARLPRGWKEIKTVGDVEPVRILVHKDTGKFGTTIDSENIMEHDSLAIAEQFVKAMQEDGAIDALVFERSYSDQPVDFRLIRLRRVGRFWVRMDGTRLPYHLTAYAPDPTIQEAIAGKRAEWDAMREQLNTLREEIRQIALGLKELEAPEA